jgi:NitT/TauT family transport system ATP-binding protein
MYENNILFTNTNAPDVIELRNISQSYDGGKTFVLKDLNLLIEDKTQRGKILVVLGVSGCGKSTLLRYICGLQKPTSGEVLINSKPIGSHATIGMVFQQYSSYPWLTVLENVELGLKFKGDLSKKDMKTRAMDMIRLVELDGHEKKYAKYPTLSGGQLQRVAIARSLVAAPEIILFDEPFGALDINTRLKMQDLIVSLFQKINVTIIMVTHDISEAVYLGDEIFIMRANPGKIVQQILVTLPYDRDKTIKRQKQFLDLTYAVEDALYAVHKEVEASKAK